MSVNLLLEDSSKPWCDIFVNKITASEIAGKYGDITGVGSLTGSSSIGFTVIPIIMDYKFTISNNLCTLWLFSDTLTSNNNNIIIDFLPPILPDKNWTANDDAVGQGLFSTGVATNNCNLQVFPKDLVSKNIRASGFSQANGASGRVSMSLIYELSPA